MLTIEPVWDSGACSRVLLPSALYSRLRVCCFVCWVVSVLPLITKTTKKSFLWSSGRYVCRGKANTESSIIVQLNLNRSWSRSNVTVVFNLFCQWERRDSGLTSIRRTTANLFQSNSKSCSQCLYLQTQIQPWFLLFSLFTCVIFISPDPLGELWF